jgi:hypothetical protein
MGRARRIALTFVAAFVAGSLCNVLIEVGQAPGARAVVVNPAGDLATLAAVTQRSVRIAYAFSAALHDLARGGVLVVPDPDLVSPSEIENLALMRIAVEDYDPSIPARLAIELADMATATGDGALERDGPEATWAIVTDGAVEAGSRLRLVFFEDAAFAVDEDVLAELRR